MRQPLPRTEDQCWSNGWMNQDSFEECAEFPASGQSPSGATCYTKFLEEQKKAGSSSPAAGYGGGGGGGGKSGKVGVKLPASGGGAKGGPKFLGPQEVCKSCNAKFTGHKDIWDFGAFETVLYHGASCETLKEIQKSGFKIVDNGRKTFDKPGKSCGRIGGGVYFAADALFAYKAGKVTTQKGQKTCVMQVQVRLKKSYNFRAKPPASGRTTGIRTVENCACCWMFGEADTIKSEHPPWKRAGTPSSLEYVIRDPQQITKMVKILGEDEIGAALRGGSPLLTTTEWSVWEDLMHSKDSIMDLH